MGASCRVAARKPRARGPTHKAAARAVHKSNLIMGLDSSAVHHSSRRLSKYHPREAPMRPSTIRAEQRQAGAEVRRAILIPPRERTTPMTGKTMPNTILPRTFQTTYQANHLLTCRGSRTLVSSATDNFSATFQIVTAGYERHFRTARLSPPSLGTQSLMPFR